MSREEELKHLPDGPGVYLMKDDRGEVIYVGKALSLKNRVRSYFQSPRGLSPRILAMRDRVAQVDYIATDSEIEALILECNLIKKYRPRYNIKFADDKHYPYLRVDVASDYPGVAIARSVGRDGARYFGPYTRSGALYDTLKLARRLFPFRTCSDRRLQQGGRPCLYHHINRCLAPCTGRVNSEEYRAMVRALCLFLEGRRQDVIRSLRDRMEEAAARLEFERAARLRDQLRAVEEATERQKIVSDRPEDEDVIGMARQGNRACVQVFFTRDGAVVGREHFFLTDIEGTPDAELLASFLKQFYVRASFVPRFVLLPGELEDRDVIARWLSARRGARVHLLTPRRGRRRELVRMVEKNAGLLLAEDDARRQVEAGQAERALTELQTCLGLPALPRRIEAFDVSNIRGREAVGSMVVFVDGKPSKDEYRCFGIRRQSGADDYAMMEEVLSRRLRRLAAARMGTEAMGWAEAEAKAEGEDQDGGAGGQDGRPGSGVEGRGRMKGRAQDGTEGGAQNRGEGGTQTGTAGGMESSPACPDLILVDGGRGQLNVALSVLADLGLAHIPVAGLAKKEEEIYLPGGGEPLSLPAGSPGLLLLQRVRDEAHRFAVAYHRRRRGKASLRSLLDEVPGVGPRRKRALLRRFGSLEGMKAATVDELAAVPGMTRAAAVAVKEALSGLLAEEEDHGGPTSGHVRGCAERDQTDTGEGAGIGG